MLQSLSPTTLTGNNQRISLPSESFPTQLRLANESPYALKILLAGDTHWLNPWMIDRFLTPSKLAFFDIVPTILASNVLSTAPSSTLLVTYAQQGDDIPGVYPLPIPHSSVSDFNMIALATAAIGIGDTVISVSNTNIFSPDQALDIAGGGGTVLVSSVDPVAGTITINSGALKALPIGTAIMRVGVVGIFGQPIATRTKSGTVAVTSVGSSASSVQLLASGDRQNFSVYNESTKILYLRLGSSAASTTAYTVQLNPNDFYESPLAWTGAVQGIWAAVNGNARITELT